MGGIADFRGEFFVIKGTDRKQHTWWISKVLGRIVLGLMGWRVATPGPTEPKGIILLAPHTSNWDVPVFLSGAAIMDVQLRWTIKDAWFFWPMSWFFSFFGAIPIDRSKSNNVVDQTVEALNNADYLYIGIPPEGTRGFRPYWKSGFYWIARKANVPLLLGFMCRTTKTCGVAGVYHTTGDVEKDMKFLADFYSQKGGWIPENFSTPVLRSTEDPSKQQGENAPENENAAEAETSTASTK